MHAGTAPASGEFAVLDRARWDDAFAEALRTAGPPVERSYTIAGLGVRLRAAGATALEPIAAAFAHLESPRHARPALTVDVWESSTPATTPPLPRVDANHAAGALYHYEDDRIRAVYQPGVGTLSVLEQGRRHAWYWMRDATMLPFWDCAAPMRQILHWWLAACDRLQVHGGAVGTPDGGVLIVGQPGSGKSTTTLVSMLGGLRYAGDDYVAISLDPTPWVHSLYCSGKLEAAHVRRFPELLAGVSNADKLETEKAVLYVHDAYPGASIKGFPLRAVVMPRVTTRVRSRTFEVSPSAALAALAPSTLIQLHTARKGALAVMARLVREIPVYGLELGSDTPSLPDVIRELLESVPT